SIVKHKHQKAAYCGLHFYDSDAYPEQYRNKLYMGNIHGGCINVDKLQRDGSTYFATGEPDFLTANDAWFRPVAHQTHPHALLSRPPPTTPPARAMVNRPPGTPPPTPPNTPPPPPPPSTASKAASTASATKTRREPSRLICRRRVTSNYSSDSKETTASTAT